MTILNHIVVKRKMEKNVVIFIIQHVVIIGENNLKKYIIKIIIVVLIIITIPLNVNAKEYGQVGYYCKKSNYNSGRLVIGDSRTCQLYNLNPTGASFVSTWGGHYAYGGEKYQIDYRTKVTTMKKYAIDTIKTKGYCNIYIFATVNDYNGDDKYKTWANNVIRLAENACKWSTKYKYKTVKPKVYVVSLVGSKGKSVDNYNDYLKEKVLDNKNLIGYIDITDCLDGSNSGYSSDNLHYNDKTLNNIWKKLERF